MGLNYTMSNVSTGEFSDLWENHALDFQVGVLPAGSLTNAILLSVAVSALGIFLTLKYLRTVFGARVYCWFCGGLNYLPVANENRFDCIHCEQYNGFSLTGDYNKDIPAQRDPLMNVFSVGAAPSGKTLLMYHNGFCDFCNKRQTDKLKARNSFVAKNPLNESEEFTKFQEHLERRFALCSKCQRHLESRLAFQDAKLLPHVIAHEKRWCRNIWGTITSRASVSGLLELLCCVILGISLVHSSQIEQRFLYLIASGHYFSVGLLAAIACIVLLVLIERACNRFLLYALLVRLVAFGSRYLSQRAQFSILQSSSHILDGSCVFLGVAAMLQTFRLSAVYPFSHNRLIQRSFGHRTASRLPDLRNALSPLLSPIYKTVTRSRLSSSQSPSDLSFRIGSLSLSGHGKKTSQTDLRSTASSPAGTFASRRLGSSVSAFSPISSNNASRSSINCSFVSTGCHQNASSYELRGAASKYNSPLAPKSRLCFPSARDAVQGAPLSSHVLQRPSCQLPQNRWTAHKNHFNAYGIQNQDPAIRNILTPPPSQDSSESARTSSDELSFETVPRDTSHSFGRAPSLRRRRRDEETRSLGSRTAVTSRCSTHCGDTQLLSQSKSSTYALWVIAALLSIIVLKFCSSELRFLTNFACESLLPLFCENTLIMESDSCPIVPTR